MAVSEGDVLEIDADSAVRHEQRGRRPVLVVSVDALHSALGLAVVCAITTHGGRSTGARNDLEVAIPPGMAPSLSISREKFNGSGINAGMAPAKLVARRALQSTWTTRSSSASNPNLRGRARATRRSSTRR